MKISRFTLFVLLLSLLSPMSAKSYESQESPDRAPVYVTLWFDTEDYVSPEPDTIILPLCQILEKHSIRATFKMIGEKSRDLEEKGQKDVIEALMRNDVGFHTTNHSQPPSMTAYLDRLDWHDGAEEFTRREEGGFRETCRIFKRTPICYGQPGSAWAPQVFTALRRWGIPLYLDEGTHVGLKGRPFYYCGLLNVFDMAERVTRMDLEGAADYEKATKGFSEIYARLRGEGGGLISIYYHPNEFDHIEFWDAVNWSHGANPPRDQWKLPRKRTPESRQQALDYFGRYLDFMQKLPGVQFVTGSDMLRIYADESVNLSLNRDQVFELARPITSEITFQRAGNAYLSAAETFSVLLRWHLRKPEATVVKPISGLMGPTRRETADSGIKVQRWEFRRACEDALETMVRTGHVPPVIWIGSVPVTPADFLATLCGEVLGNRSDSTITVRKGNFTAEKYAGEENPGLFNWVILPEGFRAPHVMELARLQCWSLKPAFRNDAVALGAEKKSSNGK